MSKYKKVLELINYSLLKEKKNIVNKKIGSGAFGVCYKIKNYVIIDSIAYHKNDLQAIIDISNELKNEGANIVPIIDYAFSRFNIDRKRLLNVHYLILQNYCEGEHLYSLIKCDEKDCYEEESVYQAKLKESFNIHFNESQKIASLDIEVYKKFIKDNFNISKKGIEVDFYNPENFLINKDGINFIDLGLRHMTELSPKALSTQIILLLLGYDYNYVFEGHFKKNEVEKFNSTKKTILNKTLKAMTDLNIEHPTKEAIIDTEKIYIMPKQAKKLNIVLE